MAKPDITPERLREILEYNPGTGGFTWKERKGRGVQRAGTVAGNVSKSLGYVFITADRKNYVAHRLAWLYVHGVWPTGEIDHINGVRHDNRLVNIRDVPKRVNCQNRRAALKTNKTGLMGVVERTFGFQARIHHNYKVICLGTFKTKELAYEAYLAAKRQLHEGCTI